MPKGMFLWCFCLRTSMRFKMNGDCLIKRGYPSSWLPSASLVKTSKKGPRFEFLMAFPMKKNRPWKKLFFHFDSLPATTDLAFSQICDVAPDDRRITTFMTMMSAEVLMERADLSYGKRVTGLAEIYFLRNCSTYPDRPILARNKFFWRGLIKGQTGGY